MSAPNESSAPAFPRRSARSSPAVVALLLQLVSLTAVLAAVQAASYCQYNIHPFAAACAQGGLAAWLTHKKQLAPWWPPIQFAFAPAALAVQSLQLPGTFFLAGFLIMLGVFWSTFRTQVPYYPSSAAVRDAVAALLPTDRPVRFIDIGSGMGGLLMHLAKRRPDSEFSGIELAPLPWLISLARNRLTGNRVRFLRGDYNRLHISRYSAVYAYLSPAAMPALWEKAKAEMLPGSLLLSYEFDIPQERPDWTSEPDRHGRRLYLWRM